MLSLSIVTGYNIIFIFFYDNGLRSTHQMQGMGFYDAFRKLLVCAACQFPLLNITYEGTDDCVHITEMKKECLQ